MGRMGQCWQKGSGQGAQGVDTSGTGMPWGPAASWASRAKPKWLKSHSRARTPWSSFSTRSILSHASRGTEVPEGGSRRATAPSGPPNSLTKALASRPAVECAEMESMIPSRRSFSSSKALKTPLPASVPDAAGGGAGPRSSPSPSASFCCPFSGWSRCASQNCFIPSK